MTGARAARFVLPGLRYVVASYDQDRATGFAVQSHDLIRSDRLVPAKRCLRSAVCAAVARRGEPEAALERPREVALVDEAGLCG